ncbi:hypothetical protein BOTCAL_0827g00030 [Botryotinia calthae]|uniref:Uncharacterized protein n=1 Tax=Botryotinia calthae TaxID=38488 RepID=A0A4Y8CFK9_9HELO|nr:hypothetical protein BOTCAL_0827g00030 [Botryotinia calthae]
MAKTVVSALRSYISVNYHVTVKVLKGPGIDPSVYGSGNSMKMDHIFCTWRFHGWWVNDAYPLGNYWPGVLLALQGTGLRNKKHCANTTSA